MAVLTSNNDTWSGFGDFDDVVDGAGGNDRLDGSGGNDVLVGGEGNDNLQGGTGDDWLSGGTEIDTIRGGNGADDLFGGGGDDFLFSNGQNAAVFSDWQYVEFAPSFKARTLADVPTSRSDQGGTMNGGTGNDRITTTHDFAGTMTIIGSSGNDVLAFGGDEIAFENPAQFVNRVDLQQQNGTTPLGGTLVVQEVESILGGDYSDVFRGDAGVNSLLGVAGNDRLEGRGGADTLDGGEGTDVADYL